MQSSRLTELAEVPLCVGAVFLGSGLRERVRLGWAPCWLTEGSGPRAATFGPGRALVEPQGGRPPAGSLLLGFPDPPALRSREPGTSRLPGLGLVPNLVPLGLESIPFLNVGLVCGKACPK